MTSFQLKLHNLLKSLVILHLYWLCFFFHKAQLGLQEMINYESLPERTSALGKTDMFMNNYDKSYNRRECTLNINALCFRLAGESLPGRGCFCSWFLEKKKKVVRSVTGGGPVSFPGRGSFMFKAFKWWENMCCGWTCGHSCGCSGFVLEGDRVWKVVTVWAP